mmetsp:Transcript_13379/g.41932  ORF Transcript_13379/g.41932 Transcript_13379/m.41932 type:complete len:287 (+) Transcript_13379:184-1044(+)
MNILAKRLATRSRRSKARLWWSPGFVEMNAGATSYSPIPEHRTWRFRVRPAAHPWPASEGGAEPARFVEACGTSRRRGSERAALSRRAMCTVQKVACRAHIDVRDERPALESRRWTDLTFSYTCARGETAKRAHERRRSGNERGGGTCATRPDARTWRLVSRARLRARKRRCMRTEERCALNSASRSRTDFLDETSGSAEACEAALLNHGCARHSCTVYRFWYSRVSRWLIRSLTCADAFVSAGKVYLHLRMASCVSPRVRASNGLNPKSITYKMMPTPHMSTAFE